MTGETSEYWGGLIELYLGGDPANDDDDLDNSVWTYAMMNTGKPNEYIRYSPYYIRLRWLRDNFSRDLNDDDDQETIDRFTRAFCMDLFGGVMFPDSSSNGVHAMYLSFLHDFAPSVDYNWGGAVLAHMYRELSRACRIGVQSINGPMLLLQIWSWTRFSIGRPTANSTVVPFGGDNLWRRHAFGVKWSTRHLWKHNPHHGK